MEGRGYQFVHIEGYARKTDARGRSVEYVLSEAERRPDACLHVAEACPPELLYGTSVAQLRAAHDARASAAMVTIAGGKTRKIRQDQLTLMTVVASHPATVAGVRNDPAVAAEVAAWEARVVAWLRDCWGDDLASVVRHTDEAHAHLHAFILPLDAEMRARRLHPGVAAKEAAKASAVAGGADAKAANVVGDKAYREAMRGLQEGFWRSVGIPSALARVGPGRRRLTRAEWHAEKAGVAAAAVALQVADVARAAADASRQEAAKLTDEAEAGRVAAEALKARADAAASRARAAITAARAHAAEAKRTADTAVAAQAEAERRAQLLTAHGRNTIEQARGEARRIVGSARSEADKARRRARGIGAWLGALLHGLRGMAPSVVARKAATAARKAEQEAAQARVALLRAEAERTRADLRRAETRLLAVSEAAARLGAQRDSMAQELIRLRPQGVPGHGPALRRG
jgi:hypothetical protein